MRLERVGVNDNFFDLGGNSILIAQVKNKLREDLQYDISVVEIFQNPTIKSLTNYINKTSQESSNLESIDNRVQKQIASVNRRKNLIKRGRNINN